MEKKKKNVPYAPHSSTLPSLGYLSKSGDDLHRLQSGHVPCNHPPHRVTCLHPSRLHIDQHKGRAGRKRATERVRERETVVIKTVYQYEMSTQDESKGGEDGKTTEKREERREKREETYIHHKGCIHIF